MDSTAAADEAADAAAGVSPSTSQPLLQRSGAIVLKAWTPYSSTALVDGRLCVSDSSARRLLLLSMGHVFGGSATRSALPAPMAVKLVRECGEGEPNFCAPYGVVAAAVPEAARDANGGACTWLYVADNYPKFPRLLRVAIDALGVEVGPRLQYWDKEILQDPTEMALGADGSLLFVSDPVKHAVLVFDATTLGWLTAIGGSAELLDTPHGLASHGAELYVAEQGAHVVSVWSASFWGGEYERRRTLGSKGDGAGCLRRPRGLAILADAMGDGSGALVVAEARRVQVLSLEGSPLQLIDLPTSVRGATLWGLSASPWEIFVCDGLAAHILDITRAAGGRAAFRAAVTKAEAEAQHAVEWEEMVAAEEAARENAEARRVARDSERDVEAAAEAARAVREAKAAEAKILAEERAAKKAARMAAARELRLKEEEERQRERERAEELAEARAAREAAAKLSEAANTRAERMRKEQMRMFAVEQLQRQKRAREARAAHDAAQVAEEEAWRAAEAALAIPSLPKVDKEAAKRAAVDASRQREKAREVWQKASTDEVRAAKARAAEVLAQRMSRKEEAARRRAKAEEAARVRHGVPAAGEGADDAEEMDAAWEGWEEEEEAEAAAAAAAGESTAPPSVFAASSSSAASSATSSAASTAGSSDRAPPTGADAECGGGEEEAWEEASFASQWGWSRQAWPWGRDEEKSQSPGIPPAGAEDGAEGSSGSGDASLEVERSAKAAERDAAIKLILARGSRTLHAALGVGDGAVSDAEVKKRALKLLRLLHPDFSINLPHKGTKKHMRIEAAFKKLSVLRDASE